MFGLGLWEIALILVIALVVLGPEKLPKVARQLGRGVRELRRAAGEVQRSFSQAANDTIDPVRESLPTKHDITGGAAAAEAEDDSDAKAVAPAAPEGSGEADE